MGLEINNRKPNLYNFKSFGVKVEDIDEANRTVKIMLSGFNNIDSDKDRIFKGAYAKSILERGPDSASNRKIAFLRMHDWNKQIGRFSELKEVENGLMAVAILGRSTQGSDAMFDYQDGIIREHSVGFKYIMDKMTYNETDACYDIKEIELWEGSAVTFGANEETFVIDVAKGLTKESHLTILNNELDLYLKALRAANGTDERLYEIEMGVKVIQSKYNKLITYEPQDVKVCTQCKGNREPEIEKSTPEELLAKSNKTKSIYLLNY